MAYDNPLATSLLKQFEGYTPKPKWDHKQYSVGFGTKWVPGQPIGGQADHEAALAREAAEVDGWLAQNVKVPLNPQQRAALTSAGYNLGTGPKGLGRLLGDINAGSWDRVGQRLLSFNKASGQVNPGLVKRRQQEAALLTGQSSPESYLAANATNEVTNNGAPMATPIGGAPIAGGPVPLTPPTQRYSKLADALLASAAGAKPKNWGELLNSAGDLALGYTLGEKHDKQQQDYRGKLAEALGGASTPDAMTSVLIGSGDDDLVKAGVSLKAKQAEANQPLRGKDRFMALPNGDVLDLNTMGPVPGIKPKQELTNDMREYAFSMKQRQDQGQPLVPFDEWAKTMKPNTANRVPSGYRETPDGRLEFIPGGPADPATKSKEGNVTEGAAKAANFANMMDKSEAELTKLAPVGPDGKPDPTKLSNPLSVGGQIREALTPEAAANHMRSPEYQQYRQAAMQWVRAKLRKESGAQISPDEFEGDFRTFFPQPGDDAKVIEQKRQARAQALEGMKAESRGSFDQMFPAAPNPDMPTPVKTQTINPQTGQAAGSTPVAQPPKAPGKAPPPQAVDLLKSNPTPEMRQYFDATFGPGMADRILGAASTSAPTQQELQSSYSQAF